MPRIALIEDNPDNRMLVVVLLEEDSSLEIIEFESGKDALPAMAENPPDLVLLDISLPDMDGTEILQKIRQSPYSNTPVIAFTAHAMDGDRESFLAVGFDGYVSKPIVDETLLFDAIYQCLPSR